MRPDRTDDLADRLSGLCQCTCRLIDSHVKVDHQLSDNLVHPRVVIDDRNGCGDEVRIMSRCGRGEDYLFPLTLQSLFVFRNLILNICKRHFVAAV